MRDNPVDFFGMNTLFSLIFSFWENECWNPGMNECRISSDSVSNC